MPMIPPWNSFEVVFGFFMNWMQEMPQWDSNEWWTAQFNLTFGYARW